MFESIAVVSSNTKTHNVSQNSDFSVLKPDLFSSDFTSMKPILKKKNFFFGGGGVQTYKNNVSRTRCFSRVFHIVELF